MFLIAFVNRVALRPTKGVQGSFICYPIKRISSAYYPFELQPNCLLGEHSQCGLIPSSIKLSFMLQNQKRKPCQCLAEDPCARFWKELSQSCRSFL